MKVCHLVDMVIRLDQKAEAKVNGNYKNTAELEGYSYTSRSTWNHVKGTTDEIRITEY